MLSTSGLLRARTSADLHLVGEEHVQHLLGAAGADDDVDAGELLAEGVEDVRQDVRGDRDRGAEAQGAELDVADLLDGVAGLGEVWRMRST